ncbi:TatD family hydrolase [Candidatus Saccharibacteria bacterium]|nr:TatD family hydrolase [Candidatus Saccharibacteria bacterium]
MLIDSHCHIHDTDTYKWFLSRDKKANPADYTPEKLVKNAITNDVKQMICIGTTHADSMRAHDFAAKYDEVFWSYGIHPEEVAVPDFSQLTEQPVAIGEVGLDYHHGTTQREQQIKLLEQMLQYASDQNLPVIFHVREAFDDFFPVVDNFPKIKAVVHSFSDNRDNLEKALNRDFYIGVNGLATFTDIPLPPLEKMLLETDAPFLAPTPYRGHTNEPAHIKDIAVYLAQRLNLPVDQIATQTTQNARNLFNLPEPS